MVRVTIDDVLRSKLGNLDSPFEFCDESGRVVGHFIPEQDRSIYDGVECPVSNEELERIFREEPGRPLDDILKDLETRQ
ncbi:MAG: hypothetical protein MI757_08365 [Pirellulales bacterium]|nr:hypothetical protein [Pirellulales bacterium]